MRTLTEAESTLINTTEYTVDWSELSETTSEERLEEMFEALIAGAEKRENGVISLCQH